jgi:hypothetical protein
MRHLRHIVLAALAIALCAPPVASAGDHRPRGGQLVPPRATVDRVTGGDAMGESWYRAYTLPAAENPYFGNGEPCVRLGRTGSILLGIDWQPVPCAVEQGTTVLVWGITWACDNASEVVDPSSYGADEAAQIRCALAGLREKVQSSVLTIDGAKPVDLDVRRYLICSPQRQVQLRADNPFGYTPGPATFTACGWVAWLKHLPPGQHTIRTETSFTDGVEEISLVINVSADHDNENDLSRRD